MKPDLKSEPIDLGDDHTLTLVTPTGRDLPVGADVEHRTPAGAPCVGWAAFDVPNWAHPPTAQKWTVESWEPLTLSPSLMCDCGDHGFVRAGKWVRA